MKHFTFTVSDATNVHAVEAAAGFVWVGCCRSPSLLLKVSPDLQTTVPITFDREGGLHDLAFDGRNLWVAHSSGHLSRVDPVTGEFRSWRLEVSGGQHPFLYCLTFDGDHLWAGTYTDPGRVLRIDPADGGFEEIVLPDVPNHAVRALVPTGDAIWAGLYTVPGRVVSIDRRSGEIATLDLREGNILCTSGAFDGRFLWFGLDTMPARVVRIDPQTHDIRGHDLWPASSCVRGLAFDGGFLWLGLYMEPGELVRFDPETAESRRYTMPPEFANVRDLALQGNTLWAVTQNVRYRPSGLYGLNRDEMERT